MNPFVRLTRKWMFGSEVRGAITMLSGLVVVLSICWFGGSVQNLFGVAILSAILGAAGAISYAGACRALGKQP